VRVASDAEQRACLERLAPETIVQVPAGH
jgi:hypothetical protein